MPDGFRLMQNYPNPFNPNTKIRFDVPSVGATQRVAITVYDILGREVSTLVNEQLQPGVYEVNFDGTNFPSGVYFYQLMVKGEQSTPYTETKKMILNK
jgi:flagellar hook assembly protein FlgD